MNTERMISALVGIGVGMVIGTLIAPDKGSKTRKELSEKSKNYLDDLSKDMKELQKNIDEKKKEAKEGIQKLKEKGEEVSDIE